MKELARFLDGVEAQVAAGFLRANNIEVTLPEEGHLGVQPNLSFGVGGYRLLVAEEDYARAKALLNNTQDQKSAFGPCANCGANALYRPRSPWLTLTVSLISLFPFTKAKPYLLCRECGHKQPEMIDESDAMSLTPPYDPDNIFAKIIRGDLPSAKVYEDGEILAFMDAFPQSEGHTLVISKTATATHLLDMPAETLANLTQHTQRIAKAVVAGLKPDGFRLVQFNGAPAGQTVFHLHFHIIPVWSDKDMGAHASGGQADPQELTRIAEIIRAHL